MTKAANWVFELLKNQKKNISSYVEYILFGPYEIF